MVRLYKLLADIERYFKVLKPEVQGAHVFYRLPTRIKVLTSIGFMPMISYRAVRESAQGRVYTDRSPESASVD